MAIAIPESTRVREETVKWVSSRPVTFDEFPEMAGPEDLVELMDGVVVEKDRVQLDHEKLLSWLHVVLQLYVEERGLGIVLGSRTAVQISEFGCRLPDLLFVRRDRMEIVRQKAIYGAPDLVIEVISPGDRSSDMIALETDYRSIGVQEIVFLHQRTSRARILRRRESGYEEEELTEGALTLETIANARLELAWVFTEPPPGLRETADRLPGIAARERKVPAKRAHAKRKG